MTELTSPPAERRWSPQGRTVRQRLLVLITAVMVLGLAVTGVVSFALQYASLRDRVEAELNQEIAELQRIAEAGPVRGGEPFTDLEGLFYAALSTAVAGEDEAMMSLIEGQRFYMSGGERDFEINHPDVLSAVDGMALPEGRARITSVRTQGTELRVLAADVRLPGEPRTGTFVIANDIGSQQQEIHRRAWTFAITSLVALALAVGLGHIVLGRLMRPLRELREAAAEISADDLSRRVEVPAADTDVAELAVRFNGMLDRLDEGVQQQRQFLDDAAHELRTPLTIVRGNAELLTPEDPQDVHATRTLILDEVDRMQRLVDDLLMLARAQRPDFIQPEPTDVTELTIEAMDRISTIGDRGWRVRTDAEGEIQVDRQRVIQALVQLAANAVKFSEPGTRIEIASRWVDGDPEGEAGGEARQALAAGADPAESYLALRVSDQGRGIPAEVVPRVFDRFVRAENVGRAEGSGLGLPIVQAIAAGHGGAASVESLEGVGSVFTLWFPADAERLELGAV
ncbi:ATP-binding protein [Ornithinimicrobium sp. Y1847]|uniref:sensor histidine kinase n=1 Tax=Ornithinimicrobium sp. Y1847 TaxID=3405419 RepID=UPI003B682545